MDDLISRQAAIDEIRTMQTYKLFAGDDLLLVDQAEAMTNLMMMPTAEPRTGLYVDGFNDGYKAGKEDAEPRKGRWRTEYDTHTKFLGCSACGGRVIYSAYTSAVGTLGYAYCPYCGARMEDEHMANLREYAHDFGVTIEQAEEALRREE